MAIAPQPAGATEGAGLEEWQARGETALYTCTTGYDGKEVKSGHLGATGFVLGIIELSVNIGFAPGNINNASTFGFPVRYESLGDIDPMWVVATDPHPEITKRSIAAGKKLEQAGCRAVMGNCGFFGNYQPQVAAELTVPFFGSSLLQVPLALATMGPDQKVGILTADGSKLEVAPALEYCGVTDLSRVVIRGVENEPEAANILTTTGHLNLENLERDLVGVATKMVKDHPDIGVIILECSEFPPHAHAIQDAVRRPVWGFATLANWIYSGVVRQPYTGWV